jgi:two-component system, NtrC family, sensor kinase
VLDAVAKNAGRLCETDNVLIYLVEGPVMRLVAGHGPVPPAPIGATRPITLGSVSGRAIVERRVVQIEDLAAARDGEFPDIWPSALAHGIRTSLAVPLLREGASIGAISVYRIEARAFTSAHIELLKTFADQAVIAIKNVRLFKDLEARNAELIGTLARHTATSEVLRAISRAQTDAQPVFDIIAASALRLCGGGHSGVWLYDDRLIHLAALQNVNPEGGEALRNAYPMPADQRSATGRALLARSVVQVTDLLEDRAYGLTNQAQAVGFRSFLAAPMLRDGEPIGVIGVGRPQPGLFTDQQIELPQTFADQAVIAIENVRLFTELQDKNRALSQAHAQVTESLEQQTATSEILQVISRSPTDVQPVLDTIAANALRLCGAKWSAVTRFDGQLIELASTHGVSDPMAFASRSDRSARSP